MVRASACNAAIAACAVRGVRLAGRVMLVVEGVSSTDVRLGVPWDVTLWVDVPAEVRLARALARDGEAMREQWVDRWMPAEDAYEAAQRPQDRVDAVVVGSAAEF